MMMANSGGAGFQEISPAQAQTMLDKGEAVLIDVREPYEYSEVHAKGATLIPLGEIQQRLAEIPTDKDVLMICRSGGRSSQACMIAVSNGRGRLYNVSGGTLAWLQAGLPTG